MATSHKYMAGVERTRERIDLTGEIFTPVPLVMDLIKQHSETVFGPGKKVLDPACGDGQFLVVAKYIKILHFHMDEEAALKEIYGVDIMRDNVDMSKKRLGGGIIIMGNTLDPLKRLEGQTDEEYRLMGHLFT